MEELLLWEFPPKVREWATLFFFWSGVAIWIGLAARFLVPARVVRGPWLTLCLGFVGSCLGPFALRSFFNLNRFDPIGPAGLLASILVAVTTLCLFYIVAFFFPSRLDEDDEDEDQYDDYDEYDEEDEDGGEEGGAERRSARRQPSLRSRRQELERGRERGESGEDERRENGDYESPASGETKKRESERRSGRRR